MLKNALRCETRTPAVCWDGVIHLRSRSSPSLDPCAARKLLKHYDSDVPTEFMSTYFSKLRVYISNVMVNSAASASATGQRKWLDVMWDSFQILRDLYLLSNCSVLDFVTSIATAITCYVTDGLTLTKDKKAIDARLYELHSMLQSVICGQTVLDWVIIHDATNEAVVSRLCVYDPHMACAYTRFSTSRRLMFMSCILKNVIF